MPHKCFVFGCSSGTLRRDKEGIKWHFFSPPKDVELFKKWERMCFRRDRNLSEKSKVCHEHFIEQQIMKGKTILLTDGNTYTYNYEHWRLAEGAYPCNFSNVDKLKIPPQLWVPEKEALERSFLNKEAEAAAVSVVAEKMAILGKLSKGCQTDDCVAKKFSKATQTKRFNSNYKMLYLKWYKRCQRLAQTRKTGKQGPVREGVFVPFSNLTDKEKLYANALARKANLKNMAGMRYHPDHLAEAMELAAKGKKTYNYIRENGAQVLPSYRTIAKMRNKLHPKAAVLSESAQAMLDEAIRSAIEGFEEEEDAQMIQDCSDIICDT